MNEQSVSFSPGREETPYWVAVIGAGPAGIFAARRLADYGVRVVLFNRDIRVGGLAEYGIYYDKYKMKAGLRAQFVRALSSERILYLGNVTIGEKGDLTLQDLWDLGFHAVLVTTGAQGIKSLGLPGEELQGVYHAKELVYHYNGLPPYSQRLFDIGRRAALIGVGNVMADIATYLVRDLQIDEVIAVARRGPAEVKFDKKEFARVIANMDREAFEAEIRRVSDRMRAVGQDPEQAKAYILSAQKKALPPVSSTRFRFRFLSAPRRILGDERGRVRGLEVEDTKLILQGGRTRPVGVGTFVTLNVDTVIFCIGDAVDPGLGLPVVRSSYATHPHPRFPVEGISYEAYDPTAHAPIEGVFLAGWAREASSGLVGTARKDGERSAEAVWQYVQTLPRGKGVDVAELERRLRALNKPVVTKEDWLRLLEVEAAEAKKRGLPFFHFTTNEEMLRAIGKGE